MLTESPLTTYSSKVTFFKYNNPLVKGYYFYRNKTQTRGLILFLDLV